MIGKTFGRLLVVEKYDVKNKGTRYSCLCSCGKTTIAQHGSLKNGTTKSCGCLRRETVAQRNTSHGEALKTPEYKSWAGMQARCYNPKNKDYTHYGARGITVHPAWRGRSGYSCFLNDVGRKPHKLYSLDRINSDGDYAPDNVRWASPQEQSANRRGKSAYGTGVTKVGSKFVARIAVNKKRFELGSFNSPNEAYLAYTKKLQQIKRQMYADY